MNSKLIETELCDYLTELIRWDAVELHMTAAAVLKAENEPGLGAAVSRSEKVQQPAAGPAAVSGKDYGEVLIPYVMNDAVESYVRLTKARMRGSWDDAYEGEVSFQPVRDGERNGIIFHQGPENTVTVWYEEAYRIQNAYRYHRIGHHWRKEMGEESIRRIVNLLCVLHDKVEYLGADAANEMEADLAVLIEFAPLCFYSPINESILSWYPETENGIAEMRDLAEAAGDDDFVVKLDRYAKNGNPEKRKEKQIRAMAEELIKPEHENIIRIIRERIEKASLFWEPRRYSEETEQEMDRQRAEKEAEYRTRGYEGAYPHMVKKDPLTGAESAVSFYEEHPFTVMESEDYAFRIVEIAETW